MGATEQTKAMSLETRRSAQSGRLGWVLGGYHFVEDVLARQFYDQGSNRTRINSDLETNSVAVFGQATYSVLDRLRVTGGLRYTVDSKRQDTQAASLPFVGFMPNVFPLQPIFLNIPTQADTNVDFRQTTWKAGLEFDAGPSSLLYAAVATGFKSGVLYGGLGRNYSDPEDITAYTIGSKNRFLGNRLQLNVEAFYWDYKHQRISGLGPVLAARTPAGDFYAPVFLTTNAGAATIWGAEVELQFRPTPADMVSANVQYLNTKYDDLRYRAYSTTGTPPVIGCTVAPTTLAGSSPLSRIFDVDCSGRALPNAPKLALNLAYDHTFSLGSAGKVVFGADTRIESSRYLSLDFLDLGRQKAYMASNARVIYETGDGRFAITSYVNNIEDRVIFSNSLQNPAKPGTIYNQPRPPRTYGVRGSVKF